METNVIAIAKHLILVAVTVPAAAMETASATTTTNYIPIVPETTIIWLRFGSEWEEGV
jgi:hypothetical protein